MGLFSRQISIPSDVYNRLALNHHEMVVIARHCDKFDEKRNLQFVDHRYGFEYGKDGNC
jgi:hypothetical protein